jgi:hypothetical protein
VGGSITVPVGGTTITIPAYMTVAALVYGIVASVLTVRVGRPLMPGVVRKNEAEAKLRFELTRLRENAESVALVGGERDERTLLSSTYSVLVGRWLHVVGLHARLTWITNASGAMVPVIPLLLATPKYLSGELSLGAVTQLAAAFAQVQVAIAWLVDNYKAVAQWQASAERVMAVVDAVEDLESDLPEGQNGIELAEHPDGGIVLEGLTVTDRAGRVLIDGADISIPRGEKVLITGESGIGKSTLTRAIAGPVARGAVGAWCCRGRGLRAAAALPAAWVAAQRAALSLRPISRSRTRPLPPCWSNAGCPSSPPASMRWSAGIRSSPRRAPAPGLRAPVPAEAGCGHHGRGDLGPRRGEHARLHAAAPHAAARNDRHLHRPPSRPASPSTTAASDCSGARTERGLPTWARAAQQQARAPAGGQSCGGAGRQAGFPPLLCWCLALCLGWGRWLPARLLL